MSFKTCVHYLAGKTQRVTFKSFSPSRKSQILDLIHSDVCMIHSRTIEDALYFVTFMDDCYRKVWAFVLKSKDHVFDIFKFFHAYVERGTRRKLKCVRVYNNGEYRGH